jgi:hypothetical protein
MTKGNDQGKKIDDIPLRRYEWNSPTMAVRYHADHNDFTLEAGDKKFRGDNLKTLIDEGRLYMNGWADLAWEPVIAIDTQVSDDFSFTYERLFRAKHKGSHVYRRWKVGEVVEDSFGRWKRSEKSDTAGSQDGVPGPIDKPSSGARVIPYTSARWQQLRALDKALGDAVEKATSRLSELLDTKDLDLFLSGVGSGTPGILFDGKAQKI